MVLHLVTKNHMVQDFDLNYENAVGSFRYTLRNRDHGEVVLLECWEKRAPKQAICKWRFSPNWSKTYTSEQIGHLDFPTLYSEIDKYRFYCGED